MSQLEEILQTALGADYRLEQEIGGGGMSRLFFATDLRLNRRVVVKVLSPELMSDTSIARFKREIELTVQLQHPHILPIVTSGAVEDVMYYITPFIAGESLKDRIARDGKLPFDDVVELLRNISGALAFAHSRGIVHRDIKPGNVFLSGRHAVLADFGIAKATEIGKTQLTATGMMPGTPAYMAPELPTDEKADVYALGVVAYEMLCGALPKRGANARQIIAARGVVAGDDRDRVKGLADLVASALSLSAENRIESAQAFCDALDRRPRTYGRVALVVAAVAVALLAGGYALTPSTRGLDASRYVVLPLSHDTSSRAVAELPQRVADAIGEWRGPSVVDERSVASAAGRQKNGVFEITDLQKVGRSFGARNVVALDTRRDGDSIVVRATLFDAQLDSTLGVRQVAYAAADSQPARAMAIRRFVNSILRDGGELPWQSASERDSASLSAWRAYDAGRAAIVRWDLIGAEQLFRSAIAAEPRLAVAHLWLAQSLLWSRASSNALDPRSTAPLEARSSARRALDLSKRLAPSDSVRAAAVLALADARYPEACDAFGRLIARDSADVGGWIGLGDCQAQDRTVLPSPGSRTGWRFRTSYERAARAYQRAAEVGPIGHDSPFQGWVLGRQSAVLYAVANRLRLGSSSGDDAVTVAAFPFLDHDTLAFEPYAVKDVATGKFDPPQAAVQAAVQRNRTQLRRSAEEWVSRAPRTGAAYDSLAGWIELSGGVGQVGDRQMTTLEVLRRARSFTTDSVGQLRLSIAEVRLLVKEGKFADARAEADSILRTPIATSHADMRGVAGLAALLGYVDRTAQFLSRANEQAVNVADNRFVVIPPQVKQGSGELLAYAALGVPGDSVSAIAHRTLTVIAANFRDSATATRVGIALVGTPLMLSYPVGADALRGVEVASDFTSRAYGSFDRGDVAGARAQLAQARAVSARSSGGAIDASFRRARLALLVGDTASAIKELDPTLRALPTLPASLFDEVPQVASFVRALALRAEIADRMLERSTAKQWAGSVVALWRNADAPLQPLVQRMKILSGKP